MDIKYQKQVKLLLHILPLIAKEETLALHGGTAINLFYNDMPRLSVDIDLTWLPYSDRESDLKAIKEKLTSLRAVIASSIPGIDVKEPVAESEEYKMRFSDTNGIEVKIEVNTINRGVLSPPLTLSLCNKAQKLFDMFCEIKVVPFNQLYGGKIVAALDRQHPRDLFDVMKLFESVPYNEELNNGVLFCLLSSKRPFHELLTPTLIDQRQVLESQFSGMTYQNFTYEMFETTRKHLIDSVHNHFTSEDKSILLSFANGEPKWVNTDYGIFPGVQWKLLNIKKLKKNNPKKHNEQIKTLELILGY